MSICIDDLTVKELKEVKRLADALNGLPQKQSGVTIENKRVVLVIDRGWIFAGDQSETSDGYVRLDDAIHVFKWSSIGFAKVISDWKSEKIDLRKTVSKRSKSRRL